MVAAEAATGQQQLEELKFLTPEVCGKKEGCYLSSFFLARPLLPFLLCQLVSS